MVCTGADLILLLGSSGWYGIPKQALYVLVQILACWQPAPVFLLGL